MYYLDSKVENLYRIFDQNARKDYLRLDLNENPGGLPQEFIDDVLKNVTPQFVAQYPETLHFTEVLADHLGTDISHVCLTNGSAEGIRYIIQAFTSCNTTLGLTKKSIIDFHFLSTFFAGSLCLIHIYTVNQFNQHRTV